MPYRVVWFDGITTQEKEFGEKHAALAHHNVLSRAGTVAAIYLKERDRWYEVCPTENTHIDGSGQMLLFET